MNGCGYIVMVGICLFVLLLLRKDYLNGLAMAVGCIVCLPSSLNIPTGLFDLTIQRVIICLVAMYWYKSVLMMSAKRSARFITLLLCIVVLHLMSMCLSATPTLGVKDTIAYAMETCLFYIILATSITDMPTVVLMVKAVSIGIACGGLAATVEKYTGFNFQNVILSGGRVSDGHDVIGMFNHRIMLGYAMAMGVPLFIGMISQATSKFERNAYWCGLTLATAGCYFSTSRGPWLGLIVGAGIMMVFGSGVQRKSWVVLGIVACSVLIIRPGVKDTIMSLSEETFQVDTLKGKSYEYRWKLWHVASDMIAKSPERTLFGYGGLSHSTMDLSSYFGRQEGGNAIVLGYTSWDNNYAADLLEYGIVGFFVEIILYSKIVIALIRNMRVSNRGMRDLMVANMAACVVFLFGRSTVYIFSPQLACQFWILVAIGTSAVWLQEADEVDCDPIYPSAVQGVREF
jgi:O-antigen ligase